MAHQSRPFNTTLLMVQLVLGLVLVVERPRPSSAGQVVFWLTVYVVLCVALQVVSVRYWSRHPRRD